MEAKKINIKKINNIDELVDKSINGTAFSYEFFLNLKEVSNLLCIYDDNLLVAFMPLFENGLELNQSTMYIPYGGPVLLYSFNSYRKQVLYTRNIMDTITTYLKNNYESISFSVDPTITDIIPFVKNGIVPEVRYTYKIDLEKSINDIYKDFGTDRKKNITRQKDVEILFDDNLSEFDLDKALVWEYNYGNETSKKFVKEYLRQAISKNKGKCFIAKKDNSILGAIAVVWDTKNCYIMYSYYDKKTTTVIPLLYYELIKYLKNNNICKYLDFEGSVFKEIEEFNLSFGAIQTIYFNFYYEKFNNESLYNELYDYGEKNEKQF